MMDRLVAEISSLIKRYGRDIVAEERFANLWQDLFPDADTPQKFVTMRNLVADGVIAKLMNTSGKRSVKRFVENQSAKYKP